MQFLKSLFSDKKSSDKRQFSPSFEDDINKAIQILADEASTLEDPEAFEVLKNHGIGKAEAAEIIVFLPTHLRGFGCRWLIGRIATQN